ncbi:MAG TPA: TetR/AcrR family transcriptional regulator [Pseudomonadales bacterium]
MASQYMCDSDGALSRRERRKQEFRERILQAAITLFEQQGCDATTLDDICTLADLSRPTFYKYFAGKQELIQALVDTLWLKLAAELTEQSLGTSAGTAQFLHGFFRMINREFSKYSRLERELIRQSMGSAAQENHSIATLQALTAMFARVYRQGRQRGEIGSEFPVDFLAEMSMAAINSVMMNWACDDNYPLARRLKQLARHIPQLLQLQPARK